MAERLQIRKKEVIFNKTGSVFVKLITKGCCEC